VSGPPTDSAMRNYYERVQEEWLPRQAQAHPYADNLVWQQNYRALCDWVAACELEHERVLEVGVGTGLLQSVVSNYVGVDITKNSAVFLHKPFSVGSAAALPFPDSSFGAAFSFWVLEHVDQPELMLAELRRVVRPGGTIFLVAAYSVAPWIAQGLHRRPFRELTLKQRLIKLTIPLRASLPYRIITTLVWRWIDLGRCLYQRPSSLRYTQLTPNFETYWDYDADACVSLDAYNVALFFLTRGDQPLYATGLLRGLLMRSEPQIYRIVK
jgi:SAM-dependent methyltransferase